MFEPRAIPQRIPASILSASASIGKCFPEAFGVRRAQLSVPFYLFNPGRKTLGKLARFTYRLVSARLTSPTAASPTQAGTACLRYVRRVSLYLFGFAPRASRDGLPTRKQSLPLCFFKTQKKRTPVNAERRTVNAERRTPSPKS